MKITELEYLIKKSIPDSDITIKDLAGDNNHYSALIRSKLFEGKTKLEQHKMVYDALNNDMGTKLHALQIKTEIIK
tara:strand:- start:2824 stop:3051 length:228 start_codon:yes stop_codon:yes gene_type:complete